MSFDYKKFLNRKRIVDAKENKAAKKTQGLPGTVPLGAGGGPKAKRYKATASALLNNPQVQYADGHRNSTPEQKDARIQNKKMAAFRMREIIAKMPEDMYGTRSKTKFLCKWNTEHQYDPGDGATMMMAGLIQEWQKDYAEYDLKHSEAENASVMALLQLKPRQIAAKK